MRTLKNWIVLLCMGISSLTYGQIGNQGLKEYQFRFKVEGLKDTVVFLGFNFGDKKFLRDTARVNSKGEFTFSHTTSKGRKDPLFGGIYLIIMPDKSRYFEFLVNEPIIHIETDTTDFYKNMKVKQSSENQIFLEYLLNIGKFAQEISDLRTQQEGLEKDSETYIKNNKRLEEITKILEAHRQSLADKNPETFAASIFNAMREPDFTSKVDTSDKVAAYKYYREHFFDNFNFRDNKFLRSPFYENKLTYYFEKVLPQIPDSLIAEAERFISQIEEDKELFKFVVHKLTFMFERSNIMCMDRAFVFMADRYYKSGRVDWLGKEDLDKIIERADKLKGVLCGETVRNINLPDTSGTRYLSLYSINAQYKVLYFWDATCGHCKKSTPKLSKLYQSFLKPNGVEVFGVEGEVETAEWKRFMHENEIAFPVVSDFPEMRDKPELFVPSKTDINSINFRHFYDLRSYPVMFILDRNNKIIGKGLGVDQLEDFIKRLLERDASKESTP
jgi:peroxiredoxin